MNSQSLLFVSIVNIDDTQDVEKHINDFVRKQKELYAEYFECLLRDLCIKEQSEHLPYDLCFLNVPLAKKQPTIDGIKSDPSKYLPYFGVGHDYLYFLIMMCASFSLIDTNKREFNLIRLRDELKKINPEVAEKFNQHVINAIQH